MASQVLFLVQVLFRKGGIKEPNFKIESTEFMLFPTGFHTDAQLLKAHVGDTYKQVGFLFFVSTPSEVSHLAVV